MEDGLSNNEVFTTVQDSQGYIWIATVDGLDRYDGYAFRVFKHDPNDPNSISGDVVRTICEDPEGRIWVGTFSDGLNLYDPKTGGFKHYRHVQGDTNSLISDDIWALNVAPNGNLLIGTYDAGLDVLNPKTGKFQHHPADSGPAAPSSNHINQIFVDAHQRVWLATTGGLDKFDPNNKTPTQHFRTSDAGETSVINSIAEDKDHRLWLATQGGAYVYISGESTLKSIHDLYKKDIGLDRMNLVAVYIDDEQNIWYGSLQSGLVVITHGSGETLNYQNKSSDSQSISSNYVWSLSKDKAGYIWISTDKGINLLNPDMLNIRMVKPSDMKGSPAYQPDLITAIHQFGQTLLLGGTGGIYQYQLNTDDANFKESKDIFLPLDPKKYGGVTSIAGSTAHGIYVGTEFGYFLEVSPGGKILRSSVPAAALGLRPRAIHSIELDGNGQAYLATFSNGLLKTDLGSLKAKAFVGNGATSLARNDIVEALQWASPSKLWVGTFRGLFLLDTSSGRSSLLPLSPGTREPVIQGVYEDARRNLWVATLGGLWRVKLAADGTPLSGPEQIPQFSRVQVLSIEPDDRDDLWLASSNSLIHYSEDTGDTLTFGRNQGSPMSEYYSYGHTRTSNGWLWFGGGQGAVGFQPQDLKPNMRAPSVTLDGVTVYREGQLRHIQTRNDLPLTLTYQDAISTFDVAAMDFGAPQANTYSYRLVGFQSQWTPPSTAHEITFTNLNPGRYRLEVRAANNWGTWSTVPAAMDIVVLPPWWRTWWAYTLYLLLIIGSSIGYVYSLKRKIEREKQVSASLREANDIKSNFVEKLQTQVAAATRELRETLQGVNLKNAELEVAQKRATEGEQVKSQFLAHMSHELRTPLTGILGFTKLLGSTALNSEQKDYIGTIHQSSETLLAIINDTLDLSKLDAGKLLIDEVDFDLLEVIESTLELLAPTAYQKRLELVRVIPPDVPLQLRGDPLRLRQILTNLLSNAIKFTESGAVAIQVGIVSEDEREAALSITVNDTGIGISEIELPQLFHAYARSRISTRQHVEGTGLGLAICKKLLDLMGGSIQVKSKVGSGTSFEFKLKFKLQKNAQPRIKLPRKLHIALYDKHPLSSIAWRASLIRLGADVHEVADLEMLLGMEADAAVLALSERELAHLGELKQKFSPALPPMLILAPRIERQVLKDLSEALYHRVLSKSAREKTVYLELQSLVQAAIQTEPGNGSAKKMARVIPNADAPYILVADDNRINRRLLVTMLSHAGFRTGEAGNGHELLDLAARGQWDAALLDIHMPGMDGIETATRLRATYGEGVPPIIAMSADVMPETRNQIQQGIMDDFIMKPFSEQELVDKLRWHLDRRTRKERSFS